LEANLPRVRHSISRFVKYLSEKGLFEPLLHHEIHQPLLKTYLAWMAHYQHAAAGTLELRAQYLTVFLRWLGSQATPQGLATLSPDGIEAFFLAYAQKAGRAARRSMQSTLRTFFRFCLYQGYVHAPLDLAVPTLRTYKLASVPLGLTDAQAQQVLQGVNRESCVGRITPSCNCSLPTVYGAAKFVRYAWNRSIGPGTRYSSSHPRMVKPAFYP